MSHVCYFDLRSQATLSHIMEANFSVYIRPPTHQTHHSSAHITYLLIYKLRPSTLPGGLPNKTFFRSKKINLNTATPGWKSFKIRSVINVWIHSPENNYGLLVECFDHNGNSLVITPGIGNTDEDNLYVSIFHNLLLVSK